ncbi:Glycosyltransferase involved in cell wall bisynthesis [Formosa sp. Hel1_31_208]|uniref:glycosyltransferase family 4 protein n=1 Tax=Formosa sp. Hel1_31_208 TaxID=1798225 RepID=UPI00087C65B3|nr:glycosyltransferase family 4 protein [Formosa sp. Hel1_31_208]SDR75413.1 Glycosyltransferase involved in cell wall bisynthesis [Formosa sp. Hel1_31_208]
MQKRLLIIGPFPDPITGNSLSNKVVYEGFSQRAHFAVDKINTSLTFFDEQVGSFSIRKLLQGIKYNLKFYKVLFSDLIYITPGQTFFGILKYGIFIFTAKLFKKKVVLHIHGNHLKDTYRDSSPLKKRMMKTIISKCDNGIVLSESLVANLTPFLPEKKIHVVYNFVEDFLVENIEAKVKTKNLKSIKLVYLSNLMEEKGILDLLEALKIMESKGIPYHAKIAGNIDHKSKSKIEDYLSLLKHTEYLGVVKGEDKKNFLLWGNIFVFPSYYAMEGQPISIIEAMSTGNIILTTNHAGISDIFDDQINGLYLQKKDPNDIITKLNQVSNDSQHYESFLYKNHCFGRENFSTKAFIRNLETIFS